MRALVPILLAVSFSAFAQSNVQTTPAPGNTGQAVSAPDHTKPADSTTPDNGVSAPANAPDDASKFPPKPAKKSHDDAGKPESDAAPEPAIPTTTILDRSDQPSTAKLSDGKDPYLDVAPMPKGTVSLIGGTVRNIDRVRYRLTVEPFGAKPMKVRFDERTHIYRDGIETTELGINKGDRVYVDTMLDHTNIFARNIHVVTETQPADARGQLLAYNPNNGTITVQDDLSGQPVRFRVDAATAMKKQGSRGSSADLQPGALIAVHFSPDKANRGVAREIDVFAVPGATYQFAGEITHLNVATGVIAVNNMSDQKTYEISFDPANTPSRDELALGAQVNIQARFTGRGYQAEQLSVTPAAAKKSE